MSEGQEIKKNSQNRTDKGYSDEFPERGKDGLLKSMLAAMILPMLFVFVAVIVVGGMIFSGALQKEVQKRLHNIAESVLVYYDNTIPGDYNLLIDESLKTTYLCKGETVISKDTSYLCSVGEMTETEITIFFYDTRMMTTLKNASGDSINGTIANKAIVEAVIQAKEEHFYDDVTISNVRYCVDYLPVFSKSGTCIGMIAVAEEYKSVSGVVNRVMAVYGIIIGAALLILVFFMTRYIRKLVGALALIREFLEKIAKGNLSTDLDIRILQREDEIGDMGRLSQYLRTSLKKLIERDPLTNLNNRRSGMAKIDKIRTKAERNAIHYSIAMGDIDFFKSVNDTYGHDAGDAVLKTVAQILSNSMFGHGTVIRWGGEEFLFAFDGMDEMQAGEHLKGVLEQIREAVVIYDDKEIRFTMSYGVIGGDLERSAEQDINLADERLYYAKAHGRNRVVTGVEFVEE